MSLAQVLPVEGIDPTNLGATPPEDYTFFRPLYIYSDSNTVGIKAEQVSRYVCGILTSKDQAVFIVCTVVIEDDDNTFLRIVNLTDYALVCCDFLPQPRARLSPPLSDM